MAGTFYEGEGPCIIDHMSYPPAIGRASFPLIGPTTRIWSRRLSNERVPLVQLIEREGLDVTYISDVTLSQYRLAVATQGVADA